MMESLPVDAVVEAVLLIAPEPLSESRIRKLFEPELAEEAFNGAIASLKSKWNERGLELVEVAEGWRFQSTASMRSYLQRLNREAPQKYPASTMQTLAVIAWRQPVTRGDIEEIRGSAPHPETYKRLMERGWIEVVGRRDTLGRPELFGTTKKFLQDLGLKSLQDLPEVDEEFLKKEDFPLAQQKTEERK